MGASLPCGPVDLKDMQSPLVTHHAANAIGGLGNWVSVESKFIIVFYEDVV